MDAHRRRLLMTAGAWSLTPTVSATPVATAPSTAAPALPFGTAAAAAQAVRRGDIGAGELVELHLQRIDRLNPAIHAFSYLLHDEARARAAELDRLAARGQWQGPLHGVPVTLKEAFGYQGQPCTWGLPEFRDARAPVHSDVARRLLEQGAVVLGGTLVPAGLNDYQSFNTLHGVSRNPWNPALTPGGSSGGSAAAVAAGFGYLSVGSDIGGSLRIPAHFSGVFAHKPTLDLVSEAGHEPGGRPRPPGYSNHLSVSGPLARSADDLALALQLLGGPDPGSAPGWRWTLPPPRARRPDAFRVGVPPDFSLSPLSEDVAPVIQSALQRIAGSGAQVLEGWPEGFSADGMEDTYVSLLTALLFAELPPEEQAARRARLQQSTSPAARGALQSRASWHARRLEQLAFRELWRRHFERVDVFVLPVAFCAAFPHDPRPSGREIATPSGPRRYLDVRRWIVPATLSGCPATTAPIGFTQDGRPVGLQVMGPFGEDATAMAFAGWLGRFVSPPGYG